ncbi:MAG: G/T mismatch repair endonuclease protein [Candidatus Shapirobacteria bacterium GW2011_GWE1_38_10]|uniref:G/T mismatch repair endonuclease protein n=1 Tax=Candidatus Shapirobacteria bacterium GW2011_GWE1_38_10 TaxID=1618488 RepID=A0A0G0I4K3_9BACT|nr:MAG: G/T mismatch repair endonuclease protein [Candidatus Shapirobacteria bacterium GW2011_GWE1_38_10]
MDIKSKEQRSENMSRIRSTNTKPEQKLFELLDEIDLPYEKHYKATGRPDAVILENKTAIFVDGEFWHGKDFPKWKNNISEFWFKKIRDNIIRDRKVNRTLKSEGWFVVRIWGKSIIKNPEKSKKKILKSYNNRS